MKKIYYFLFVLVIIISNTGCTNKSPKVTLITKGLSFTMETENGEEKIICNAKITKDGNGSFAIVEPSEIKGLTFNFKDGTTILSYKELSHNLSGEPNETNIVSVVYNIFTDINNKKSAIKKNDNNIICNGKINGCNYTVWFGATGLPLKILYDKNTEIIIKSPTAYT